MKNELQTYVSHIEKYLDGCFDFYEFEPQGILFDSMRYSLLAGGKRLRPVFVFDFCRMAAVSAKIKGIRLSKGCGLDAVGEENCYGSKRRICTGGRGR